MKDPERVVHGRVEFEQAMAEAETERQWLARLITMAREENWQVHHVFEQRNYARRTVRGWPDLELLRERLIFVEAKTETGELSAFQEQIIGLLRLAGQEVYVLRPSQEDEARRILHRRVRA